MKDRDPACNIHQRSSQSTAPSTAPSTALTIPRSSPRALPRAAGPVLGLLGLGAVGYGISESLYTVEGGHRGIMYGNFDIILRPFLTSTLHAPWDTPIDSIVDTPSCLCFISC